MRIGAPRKKTTDPISNQSNFSKGSLSRPASRRTKSSFLRHWWVLPTIPLLFCLASVWRHGLPNKHHIWSDDDTFTIAKDKALLISGLSLHSIYIWFWKISFPGFHDRNFQIMGIKTHCIQAPYWYLKVFLPYITAAQVSTINRKFKTVRTKLYSTSFPYFDFCSSFRIFFLFYGKQKKNIYIYIYI